MMRRAALLLAALALPPASVEARADERVFDPHFWAHPRYIDPTYDFEAPRKETRAEDATASKPGEDEPRERTERAGSGRRRR